MAKLTVAVIFGGRSGEHEVSVLSARSVIKFLNRDKYEVLPVYIGKTGQWFLENDVEHLTSKNDVYLTADPSRKELTALEQSLHGRKIDVVFPLLHGTYGEDGSIQGLLELANLPYVGAGVLGSAVGMDKAIMKKLLASEKLPVVSFEVILRKDISQEVLDKLEKKLAYPVFVKPANLGSSVGITKVHNRGEFLPALQLAAEYDRKIVVEAAVPDVREIEVSILGNDDPEASLPGEVIPSNEFYDYDAKYVDGKSTLVIPADLPTELVSEVQTLGIRAFKALDLQGMARVDFLLSRTTGKLYISEVNTIPGFTSISMYPKMWENSGLNYPELLDKLIWLAKEVHQDKQQNKTSFETKLKIE